MKRLMWTLAVLPLLASSLTAAPAKDPQAEAQAILDKAIKAVGGEEKLTKITSCVLKVRRKFWCDGAPSEDTAEISYCYPGRSRTDSTEGVAGGKATRIEIFNGDKAWTSSGGKTLEIPVPPHEVARLNADPFPGFHVRQLPLFKGKDYELTLLGESKVEERRVVGVKVASEGKPELRLFFDKDTGLLLKREYEFTHASLTMPIKIEETYEDYKEACGIKYPSKATQIKDGQKTGEVEITEFKVVDKFDEKTFAKPE